MDRLISLQAAIDSPVKMVSEGIEWIPVYHLKGLPSAQPERLTDDDFETIRIHLNAYKEKLCNQQRWKEAEEYQRIIDRFMTFASAQTNLQPTCNELATDTISRKAAVDAIDKLSDEPIGYLEAAIDALVDLPSAQPEIVYCKDCICGHGEVWLSGNGSADLYGYCGRTQLRVVAYDYCSYAKRRTDESD